MSASDVAYYRPERYGTIGSGQPTDAPTNFRQAMEPDAEQYGRYYAAFGAAATGGPG